MTEQRVGPTLQVGSIVYQNEPQRIRKAISHLNRAVEHAVQDGVLSSVDLVCGDCSPRPMLDAGFVQALASDFPAFRNIRYRAFRRNFGSALGQTLLGRRSGTDYLLIVNPDVMFAPNALIEMMKPFADPLVGVTEARQLPIEHPKAFDTNTGSTGWATGACAMTPTRLFRELGGFDYKSFFLYCDDVDYSWRVRLRGMNIVMCNNAVAFHDKRLGEDGRWLPGKAEQYFSAEAALMMAHKYSRPDIVKNLLAAFESSGIDFQERAATTYRQRKETGQLPAPIDQKHLVAEFIGHGQYGHRRYDL